MWAVASSFSFGRERREGRKGISLSQSCLLCLSVWIRARKTTMPNYSWSHKVVESTTVAGRLVPCPNKWGVRTDFDASSKMVAYRSACERRGVTSWPFPWITVVRWRQRCARPGRLGWNLFRNHLAVWTLCAWAGATRSCGTLTDAKKCEFHESLDLRSQTRTAERDGRLIEQWTSEKQMQQHQPMTQQISVRRTTCDKESGYR